ALTTPAATNAAQAANDKSCFLTIGKLLKNSIIELGIGPCAGHARFGRVLCVMFAGDHIDLKIKSQTS
ncbi:hypothetical protein N9A05_05205, partial [Gammaproteobacteria bacterium]|nr:hypothetical protein [Gammaproteobacteria bacterium]